MIWEGHRKQARLIESWLGTLHIARTSRLDLGFYENFHGVELVVV